MMPVSELRLDPLVPIPDHVAVQHVDEPVHRDAREAPLMEELLPGPAENPSVAALSGEQPFALIERVRPCSLQMRIHSGHR